MKIQFLGTGTALSKTRGWSSFIINDSILVDPPPDVTHSLSKLKIDTSSIKTILISHFHADHFFGMPFLTLELFYFRPDKSPQINLIAPSKAKEKISALMSLAYEDVVRDTPEILDIFEIITLEDKLKIEINDFSITSYSVYHNGLEAYALKFDDGKNILSFTGDTGMCQQLKHLVADSNIMIAEMSNIDNSSPDHLNFQEVVSLKEMMPSTKDKIVIATHLKDTSPNSEEIIFANDFETFKF